MFSELSFLLDFSFSQKTNKQKQTNKKHLHTHHFHLFCLIDLLQNLGTVQVWEHVWEQWLFAFTECISVLICIITVRHVWKRQLLRHSFFFALHYVYLLNNTVCLWSGREIIVSSFPCAATINEHFYNDKLWGHDSFAWCLFLQVHWESWLWKQLRGQLKAILTLSRKQMKKKMATLGMKA